VTAVALAPVPPPWIGFLVKQRKGKPVIIEDVAHDGPAEKCGLQDGDVMVSIAGDPIRTMKDFWRSMKKHKYIGNIIPVVVNRPKDPSMSFQDGDETAEVTVELEVGIKRRTVLANVPPLRTVADILPLLEDAAGLRLVVKSGFSTIDDDLSGLISDEEFKTGFREWLGPELSGYLTNEDVEDLWTKGGVRRIRIGI
jgi:membrane-associated protease RseP (regulator of RpoE activity)